MAAALDRTTKFGKRRVETEASFALRSDSGQQRPNEAIDFESALTSTPDITLHRTSSLMKNSFWP
jgi:hypothetical protein